MNTDAERQAGEIRLRAELKTGELIPKEQAAGRLAKRGTDKLNIHHGDIKTLADYGISRDQSSRRHMSKGARALAVAMIYPEPTKHKRAGQSVKIKGCGIDASYLSQARTVLYEQPTLAQAVLSGSAPLSDADTHRSNTGPTFAPA